MKSKSYDFEIRASLLIGYIEKNEWIYLEIATQFLLQSVRVLPALRNIKTRSIKTQLNMA